MGKYATTTSLEVIMVGTTFDTSTAALASKMITHAENEVDKYLSKRYDLSAFVGISLSAMPPLLTSLTETLAEGYFFQRNSRGGGADTIAYAKELIKGAQENLKLIAERKLDLIGANGDPVDESVNAGYQIKSSTNTYSSTFNEDSELDWEQDQDKLDDIDSERS